MLYFQNPKWSCKSSSDVFLVKFPSSKVNFFWKLDSLLFVVWRLIEKFHAQIVTELYRCYVHVKNVVVVVVEYFSFLFSLVFSPDFSLILQHLERPYDKIRTFPGVIYCFWHHVTVEFLIFPANERQFLTFCNRVFNVSCKTNKRQCNLFAKLIFHKLGDFRKV